MIVNSISVKKMGNNIKNGFTLIEISIVLLIMGILVGGILVGTHGAQNNGYAVAVKQNISSLVTLAHGYGSINSSNPNGEYYGFPTVQTNPETPYLPSSYQGSKGIPNAFGGYVSISLGAGSPVTTFTVTATGIPSQVAPLICQTLISGTVNGNSCAVSSSGSSGSGAVSTITLTYE